MDNYNSKTQKIVGEVLELPRGIRLTLLQQLMYAVIKKDNLALITFLRTFNVKDREIAKVLGIDPSNITKDYPKNRQKA